MIEYFRKKQIQGSSDVLLAFVQAWNKHGKEEIAICSDAIDALRAYMGIRPVCIWKYENKIFSKICERGMVDIFLTEAHESRETFLSRAATSGLSEFEECLSPEFKDSIGSNLDGFIHVPLKTKTQVSGLMSVGVNLKESKDASFVQTLECMGRLLAVALHQDHDQEANEQLQRRLKAEVNSTTRELAQTNNRLIERVRELKLMSKELERRIEELTHANKAKDEFLSIVSHELRTPLTSLKGFLCVLLDGDAGDITEPQRKFLSIAKQSADRLNVLISDLLDVSRIESGRLNLDMNVCSLADILTKSVEGLKKSAELKNIKLNYEGPARLPHIMGDDSRLLQVIDNILSNALKFTPHNGVVTVRSEDKGEAILVSIQDSGPGLKPAELNKVFDMFYQVDASARRSAGGAGLGLAIANGIVSMHGGKLWCESPVNAGATFHFIIPRYKAKEAA